MICPTCGHENPAGSRFCADCQAFLAWDAEAAGPPGGRAVPPSPAPRPDERAPAAGSAGAGSVAGDRASAPATGAPVSGSAVPETAGASREADEGPVPPDPAVRWLGGPDAAAARGPDSGEGRSGSAVRGPDASDGAVGRSDVRHVTSEAGVVRGGPDASDGVVRPSDVRHVTSDAGVVRSGPDARDGVVGPSDVRHVPSEAGVVWGGPDVRDGGAGRSDVAAGTAGARRPDEREEAPRVAADTVAVPVVPAPPSEDGDRRPDRTCPRCRAANPPDRHLCARCGTPLDPPRVPPADGSATPAGRVPWWRRWWRRTGRRDRGVRAVRGGRRPQPRVRRRLRSVWPVVVLALAAAGWFARGELTGLVTLVHDHTTKQTALHPDTWAASSSAPGHPAKSAFDGFSNRYWAPAAPGKGVGQYVEAGFHRSVHLETVLITPGCSVDDGTFLTQARPARITLTLTAADGRTTRRTLSLDDQAGPQTFTVHASGTVHIRLTTDASYGAGRGRRVALAEVEFFGRR